MPNMSYCMIENTYKDMDQLHDALCNGEVDFEDMSDYEKRAAKAMLQIMDSLKQEIEYVVERTEE